MTKTSSLDDTSSMAIRIILVHGTFSKNPEWTHSDSLLSSNLAKPSVSGAFPMPFSWSGRNSPKARHIAAMELRNMLEGFVRESPDSHFLIIGHSHGGTVAIRAIDCDLLRERSSIACLSTPFIQVLPREIPMLAYTQVTFALALCVAGAVMYLISQLAIPSHFRDFLRFVPVRIYVYLYAFAAALAFVPLNALKTRLIFNALETANIVQHNPEISSDRVQILRTTGDEASMVIGISQILSWLSSKCAAIYVSAMSTLSRNLDTASSWLQDQAGNYSMVIGKTVAWLLLLWLVLDMLSEKYARLTPLLWIPMGLFIVGAICVVVYHARGFLQIDDPTGLIGVVFSPVLLVLIPISFAFAVFGVFGFGAGTGILALFFELSVEAAPQGTWNVTVFRPMRVNTLRHGHLYNNPLAVEHICIWVQENMRRLGCRFTQAEG